MQANEYIVVIGEDGFCELAFIEEGATDPRLVYLNTCLPNPNHRAVQGLKAYIAKNNRERLKAFESDPVYAITSYITEDDREERCNVTYYRIVDDELVEVDED